MHSSSSSSRSSPQKRRRKKKPSLFPGTLLFILLIGILLAQPRYFSPEASSSGILLFSSCEEPISSYSPMASPDANPLPRTDAYIQNVPLLCQFPEYPTGCETISALMVLQYYGETIQAQEFISSCLPMESFYRDENNLLYGPDPNEFFPGHPSSENSFGCYAPVICTALENYFGSPGRVRNATGYTLEKLCSEYIDRNIPVMVWVSIQMEEPYYSREWILPSGETFCWLAKEHCMVLVGYDPYCYIFHDPYTGEEVSYSRSLVSQRYEAFGRQSVAVLPPADSSPSFSHDSPADT